MKRVCCLVAAAVLCLTAAAQVKVVGHRGVRFNTPFDTATPLYENTIPALRFNQSLGVYAAEFDVQLTADEKLIVFHGPSVPGLGKSIHNITFAEARSVVLPGGSIMPTLEEYLAEGRKHPETKLILEVKKQPTPERETKAVELIVETVRRMKMQGQIEYTTFSDWEVQEIHRLEPSAKVIFIDSGWYIHDPDYCYARGYNAVSYDLNGLFNHPEYVDRAHQLGMEVTLWVVNDKEIVDWAIKHGVDFVSSDNPEKIKEYLNSLNR